MAAKKKLVAKKKPARTPAPKKRAAARKSAPRKRPARARPAVVVSGPSIATAVERLGEVTAPSGTLALFDVGLVGYLPRPALEPALVKADVPRDRTLPVLG